MLCPFCGSNQIAVVNSRATKGKTQIWRRRKCLSCKETYSTYEKIDLSYVNVTKKSGHKQRYNRAKLFAGIYHSTLDRKNVDRGSMSVLAEELTNDVEATILGLRSKNVTTSQIKEIVLEALSKKTPDSFLRFLAYRESGDLRKLKSFIRKYF